MKIFKKGKGRINDAVRWSAIFLISIIFSLVISCIIRTAVYAGPAVKLFNQAGAPMGVKMDDQGALEVNVQDQDSRSFDFHFIKIINSSITISEDIAVNSYSIPLTAGHGLSAGGRFVLFLDQGTILPNIYSAQVISVQDTNTMIVDSPIPCNFTAANVTGYTYSVDMNVDGSSTVQIFELTNPFSTPADITRFIFHITDATAMDDGTFGGMNELARGLLLRKKISEGNYINLWGQTVKNNGDFGELSFDKIYDPKPPAGTGYGMTVRTTYAGQDKHGVAIRLEQNQSIQLLVQDALGDLSTFVTIVQGHFTNE